MNFGKTALTMAAIALSGLMACKQEGATVIESPAQSDYQTVKDVKFLYDDQGNVPHQFPLEVLQDIRAQLKAEGQAELLKDLESLYNLETGMVLDPEEAIRTEKFLKANLPSVQTDVSESTQVDAPAKFLPEGMELPPEVAEHQRELQLKEGK